MMSTENTPVISLKDYAPSAFLIPNVHLAVVFTPQKSVITSRLDISPQGNGPLELDGDSLSLSSVSINGQVLSGEQYKATPDRLTILDVPNDNFVLETEVILDPSNNTELMGLYRSNGVWCTQCEPEGFRRITYFLDRPDVLSIYTVRMTANKTVAPVLLANGDLTSSGDLGDNQHFAEWHDPHPKPSYLFAMVAGDLGKIEDRFVTASGREVALGIYCEHGKTDRCGYAMDALKRSMAWDEKRFGREYDLAIFNIVAVSDFNFGAMENKGLNIFNDRYILADAETATDADYANIERIIAHEYFHNWTGNRITCRDWFQLCLKEGLTVYRDQEFTSDERSRAVQRIGDVRGLRAAQFPEDAGPLAHSARPEQYSEINNFYTATVYQKGAEIVRMLATLLGTETFRKGTDLYFERHDGQATTIEAWLKVFEDLTGDDFGQFSKWYMQAGTPQVTATGSWDEARKTYKLILAQKTLPTPGQLEKDLMVIPIKFGLLDQDGHDMNWQKATGAKIINDVIVFDEAKAEILFEGLESEPTPSLLREFSAPIVLKTNFTNEDQLFLARHDSDPFNKWQALQDVAMTVILDTIKTGSPFLPPEKTTSALLEALRETLENPELDDAFKAQALLIPAEGTIAQAVKSDIDPEAIHTTRNRLLRAIGRRLEPELKAVYLGLKGVCVPYILDTKAARARSLRNQCLSLLAAAGTDTADNLLRAHYEEADNMTDRMSALGAAVRCMSPSFESMLHDFKVKFGEDPLNLDKWLSLTASSPRDDVIEKMQNILADPTFPRTNPNRLRSLVGAFAAGNQVQFTRKDGAGFRFVTKFCRDIDGSSPQVAARVLTAFKTWRDLEKTRKNVAQSTLNALKNGGPLSTNTGDILSRIVG